MAHDQHKHPLPIRVTHWINFPVLLVMMWSGALIYWANDIYWPPIPSAVYEALDIKQRLADGLAYHFVFMWIFTLNGVIYVSYLLASGKWRTLFPTWRSFPDAWQVILHDLKMVKRLPPQGKYNGAQRILYTLALILGAGAVITGLAMYKPVQLNGLKNLLGGYEMARWLHYLIAIGFLIFIFVHVVQVVRAGWRKFSAIVTGSEASTPRRHQFQSFGTLLVFLAVVTIGLIALRKVELDQNIPRPLRIVLDLNAKLGHEFLDPNKTDRLPPQPSVRGKKARENGDAGLAQPMDVANWRLHVVTQSLARTEAPGRIFQISDITGLPKTEITVEFKCIEGWSEIMSFAGVPFMDFLKANRLGTKSGAEIDLVHRPDDLYRYVGLETPDGEYYVAIDMKSALNPQTLLAYEQNGEPLTVAHGAPLRLYIPNKYGVKSLKRIGTITFSDTRPRDYWHEDGYDWFIGL